MLTSLFYRKVLSKSLPDIKILFLRLRNFEKQIRSNKKWEARCHKAFHIRRAPLFDKIVRKAGLIQIKPESHRDRGAHYLVSIELLSSIQHHNRMCCLNSVTRLPLLLFEYLGYHIDMDCLQFLQSCQAKSVLNAKSILTPPFCTVYHSLIAFSILVAIHICHLSNSFLTSSMKIFSPFSTNSLRDNSSQKKLSNKVVPCTYSGLFSPILNCSREFNPSPNNFL